MIQELLFFMRKYIHDRLQKTLLTEELIPETIQSRHTNNHPK